MVNWGNGLKIMTTRMTRSDIEVLLVSLLLTGFGIVFVYSSSFAVAQQRFGGGDFFLARHVVRAFMALVCLFLFMKIDYHALGKYAGIGYVTSVVLMVYVLTMPDSAAINGAKRWICLGSLRFQVSEFARIALVVFLASRCVRLGEELRKSGVFVRQLVKIGIVCLLIVLEPDFSTAGLIGVVGVAMLFVAGARIVHLLGAAFVVLPATILAVLATPYRRQRLAGFLNMADNSDGVAYQIHQSLIGIGNGGLFGVGLGQGEQKYFYLPEPHTDFVFSVLGEEIGFLGLLVMLSLFVFLLYRGIRIAHDARDPLGRLMAFGLTFALGAYVILHAAVNTGIVPTTGVPLPFLSYGGMSLVFTMCSVGILLNISSQSERAPGPSPGRRSK